MTIYEIDAAITALADENGEITDWEALDALQMEREQKIDNIIAWIKDLNAEAAAIRNEELELAERRHKKESKAESLEAYLKYALNGANFESTRGSVRWRRTQVAKVTDANAFMECIRENGRDDLLVYAEPKISKKALLDALKNGEQFDGAELDVSVSMSIK